jgi:hypothetical protein
MTQLHANLITSLRAFPQQLITAIADLDEALPKTSITWQIHI